MFNWSEKGLDDNPSRVPTSPLRVKRKPSTVVPHFYMARLCQSGKFVNQNSNQPKPVNQLVSKRRIKNPRSSSGVNL